MKVKNSVISGDCLLPALLLWISIGIACPAYGTETSVQLDSLVNEALTIDAHGTETLVRLDSLVDEALTINPALQAIRYNAEAADLIPPRVGTLPDPVIGVDISNFRVDDPSLSGSPMSGIQLAVRQGIPFPGKLRRRRDVALADAKASWSRVHLREADLVARVKVAYWNYYFAVASEQITRENVAILNLLVGIANSRFSVGEAAQQDVLKAQVAYAQLRESLLTREQESATAREFLNTTVGRDPSTRMGKPMSPQEGPLELDRETLIEAALAESPQLIVERNLVEKAEQAVREAGFDRLPDLQFAGGYRIRGDVAGDRTAGADMFFVSLGMSLPIFAHSKQNKRVQETKQRRNEAEQRRTDVKLSVQFETQRLLDEIERLSLQEEIYRLEILPEAQMALDASLSDYQVARVEFISVLDNWRRLFDAQIAFKRVLAERQSRLANLEALVGRSLP